jgi:hypothetical protein
MTAAQPASGDDLRHAGAVDHSRLDDPLLPEVARESVTMALYQSLSLLAVLLATPSPTGEDTRVEVALTVFLTGLGLLLAHHMAFRISSRLVNAGVLSPESTRLLRAQALGGLPVIVLASIPPLVFGVERGTAVSELVLLGIVALVGYRAVRQAVSRGRAIGYLLVTVVVAGLVIALKLAVGH